MTVYVSCLAFNRAEMVEGALENFERTTTAAERYRVVRTIFSLGFPIPAPDENGRELLVLADRHRWNYTHPIENRSVIENHRQAVELLGCTDDDYYVTWDPDVRMQQTGWLGAMKAALDSDPDMVFCVAAQPFYDEHDIRVRHERKDHVLADGSGTRIATFEHALGWSMGMYKASFLRSLPKDFAAKAPIYGHVEHAYADEMRRQGKRWCCVADFYDHHQGADPLYSWWKEESSLLRTALPFVEWLKTVPK